LQECALKALWVAGEHGQTQVSKMSNIRENLRL
jgi:hypothetical protein